MRILLLINSLSLDGGGAERATANLANHFAGLGHHVTVVTLSSPTRDIYPLASAVEVIGLGVAVAARSPLQSLLTLVRSALAVRRVLAAVRPDAAIGMMSNAAILLALAGRPLPVKLLGSERTYPPAAQLPRAWRMLRKLCYRRLDRMVAQTGRVAEWLREHTGVETTVIPNPWLAPANAGVPVLPNDLLPPEGKVILGAGRLAREKRFDLLIRAFAGCAGNRPDWRLVIVGSGPLHGDLRALADRLGLADRVLLPGRAGNLAEWYSRSDIFALSSEFEGFPNVLLEAMGCGLATLAYDCPAGPGELIQTERNGILIEPLSLDGLTEGLCRLMDSPDLRARLGAAATEVRSRYAFDRIGGQWLAAMSA